MMKVSDFVFKFLADRGVRHVFLVTGGGAMHLNDSLGREKRILPVCNHHEQGCTIGAEGYARAQETLGVASVTTGPGGTNAMTGVLGQWLDSIPAIIISGQVRWETTAMSTGLPLRQLGDQEANIIPMVQPITKYAVSVTEPTSIRKHLEKAWYLALSGRPGPVWIDLPLNVQGALVDETALPGWEPAVAPETLSPGDLQGAVARMLQRLKAARRPVVFGGSGVRSSGAARNGLFLQVLERLGAPVQLAWNAIDLLPSVHELNCGRPSTLGQRAANFIFQNSDFLLNVGCRMNLRQIGYTYPAVAREAWKVSVDVDPAELHKPTFRPDEGICADAQDFLRELLRQVDLDPFFSRSSRPEWQPWLDWCRERQRRYPLVPEAWKQVHPMDPALVNPYHFCETLGQCLDPGDVVVSSNGASCVVPIQAMGIRAGVRHIVNSGCAAMGYGLPAAVGACFAAFAKRVICLEGDGSIQMNIQELQTAVHHQLDLKIFVFSNGGYLSIRTTQNNLFAGHLMGEGPGSGVSFPDLVKLAQAYGLKAFRLEGHEGMEARIREALSWEGPVLVDVRMDPEQVFMPRVSSKRLPDGKMVSSPLEDLFPFLDKDEFRSNMIIPTWENG